MKTPLITLAACLMLAAPCLAQERIIVVGTNAASVQLMLNQGWTVKHQSCAMASTSSGNSQYPLIVFTLTPPAGWVEPPPPKTELQLKLEARRKQLQAAQPEAAQGEK